MSDRILILGLGSIGQRHARNALKLGCEVIGYDPRFVPKDIEVPAHPNERTGKMSILPTWECSHVRLVQSVQAGLNKGPLGVIVATPPETHHELALATVAYKIPTLIEKPLAPTVEKVESILAWFEDVQAVPLAVGYQLRHFAALKRLKAQADAGEFGEIYAAHAEFASQQWCSHTYKADLLLECSHELDLLRWFLGEPQSVTAWGFSGREMRAGMIAFSRGTQATFHLDGLAPGYRRRLTLYGTKGVGEWTFDKAENDQAYMNELAEFLRVCRGEQMAASCTGRDGWWAVRMVEAIRRSGESGRWEQISVGG